MRVFIGAPPWKNKELLDILKQRGEIVIADKTPTKSELIGLVQEFDGIIVGRLEIIDKEVLENSKLKFIGIEAKGTNNVDIDECKRKNIAVFYTPEANITSVAEHVLTLILSLAKNLIKLDTSVRKEEFDKFRHSTVDVKDKTLGIIGAGAITKEIIKRAKAFEMNILCCTKNPKKHKDLDVKFVPLTELLKNSDFISINLPLTDETKNFIDEKELSLMKKSAFLINTSRGKIVNENALVKVLKSNKIAGAGIDVFEEEPTHNRKLFELDNVILTPHVAGVSKEALYRMEKHLIDDIVAFLNNKKPKYRLV